MLPSAKLLESLTVVDGRGGRGEAKFPVISDCIAAVAGTR